MRPQHRRKAGTSGDADLGAGAPSFAACPSGSIFICIYIYIERERERDREREIDIERERERESTRETGERDRTSASYARCMIECCSFLRLGCMWRGFDVVCCPCGSGGCEDIGLDPGCNSLGAFNQRLRRYCWAFEVVALFGFLIH